MNRPLLHPALLANYDTSGRTSIASSDVIEELTRISILKILGTDLDPYDVRHDEPLDYKTIDMLFGLSGIAKALSIEIRSGKLTFECDSIMHKNIQTFIELGSNRLKEAVEKYVSWWTKIDKKTS